MTKLLKLIDVKTLSAGVIPVLYGVFYSWYYYKTMNMVYAFMILIAIILIQSCANMLNDVYDHQRGADGLAKSDEKVIAAGEMSLGSVKKIMVIFVMIDLCIALYFAINVHIGLGLVAILGALIMVLYSAGPKPISYTAFGEVVAGLTMGLGIMTTVIYIMIGTVDYHTLIIALPTSVYIGTILLTNNISDHIEDQAVGRRTLAIELGPEKATNLWVALVYSLPLFTLVFFLIDWLPAASLLTSLLLFPYRKAVDFRFIKKSAANKGQMMALISMVGIRYHLGIILGLILELVRR